MDEEGAQRAIQDLLSYLGEDPQREGLVDTPARVVRAWEEMTSGYGDSPEDILSKNFEAGAYDQIIACTHIEFTSTCEHHMLPFIGYAHVAYLPAEGKESRVVGLSKMARLVDCYARRLQIQEKMTLEIADAMSTYLKPRGVAVVIQAKHQCMMCRGVKKQSAVMLTSQLRGTFLEPAARMELFKIIELSKACNE